MSKSMEPGDEVILDIAEHLNNPWWSDWAKAHHGKKVRLQTYDDHAKRWRVEGHFRWIDEKYFKPIGHVTTSAPSDEKSDGCYCECASPSLTTNFAGGNQFRFCRHCKKERV